MGLLGAVSLGIGVTFAWIGLWPILPFAGLELLAVGVALFYSLRRNAYREVVSFDAEMIGIEFGEVGRGIGSRVTLPRGRTRVLVESGPYRNSPNRLLLTAFGNTVELGRCLTDVERERLAFRMRQLIHPAWCPAAAAPEESATDGTWN